MRMFGDWMQAGVLCDPVSAIVGGVGLVGNLVSGAMGAKAAKSAADIQAQAAAQAGQKVVDTTNAVNPNITASAATGASDVSAATGKAAEGVTNAAGDAEAKVINAGNTASDLQQPYIDSGSDANNTLRTLLATGGDLNRQFSIDDFKNLDPGFQFRLQEAQKALERSTAARGGSLGGGAAKALQDRSEDVASSEFQNAFNRFETSGNDRFNRLNAVAQRGQTASTTAGNAQLDANKTAGAFGLQVAKYAGDFNTGGAEFGAGLNFDAAKTTAGNSIAASRAQGDYLTQGANAQAAGKVGAANAWGGAIGGAINGATSAIQLRNLLRNPAIGGSSKQPGQPGYNPNADANWGG